MFSDVLNLIFRDELINDNVDLKSAKLKEREQIVAKCLQFLRQLAKYNVVIYNCCMCEIGYGILTGTI